MVLLAALEAQLSLPETPEARMSVPGSLEALMVLPADPRHGCRCRLCWRH